MVKVRADFPTTDIGDIDLDRWLRRLPFNVHRVDLQELSAAFVLSAERARDTAHLDAPGRPPLASFYTGLEMVEILAELQVDQPALVAAALYRSVREGRLDIEVVRQRFGDDVAALIDGVAGMAAISQVSANQSTPVLGQAEAQSATIRKMLVSLVDDVRVALIKLAERTCAIRAVKNKPEKRYRVAREVFDVYAPLAHRLGIGHIKWELEDLSFRYLQPQVYKKIAKLLDEKRLDRQTYIDTVIDRLHSELKNAGIDANIVGRAKHIYSIWRKMQRKAIGFSQVYDIRAVRILVPETGDCYAVLGIIHGLWKVIPHEFDDYIANPKENGYRSLHTAVVGLEGKVLEIQIRTVAMHDEAEFGICAHWAYKGADINDTKARAYEQKIAWLRQVIGWDGDGDTEADAADIADELRSAQERVYVFTRDGHVVNLQAGATPLDFAYHIHTEVGHRCRGAKVNGRIVPLISALKTGDRVEILTAKESIPRRDWLQASEGYIVTPRARQKIQHWFRQQAREDNATAGRALLEKEFRRLALTSIDYKTVASKFGYQSVDDMYVSVGAGELSLVQVIKAANAVLNKEEGVPQPRPKLRSVKSSAADRAQQVKVSGVGQLATHFAGCCKPLPGEPIAGYITVGRVVSVHRQDCKKFLHLNSVEPQRVISVDWDSEAAATWPVEVDLVAYDRQGLLRDITNTLAESRANVLSLNTRSESDAHQAHVQLRMEITDLSALSQVFSRLSALPNVISVTRRNES